MDSAALPALPATPASSTVVGGTAAPNAADGKEPGRRFAKELDSAADRRARLPRQADAGDQAIEDETPAPAPTDGDADADARPWLELDPALAGQVAVRAAALDGHAGPAGGARPARRASIDPTPGKGPNPVCTAPSDAERTALAASGNLGPASPRVAGPTARPDIGIEPATASATPDTGIATGEAAAPAPSLPPPLLSGTSPLATGRAPVVPEFHLPERLGSPEFAPALGAQLRMLARDGVGQARLQLNPAELGPITVQITVNGQAAMIDLVAEQSVTRQVLEQSMPVLAGSLRESGLTLTGGGVFEQARDRDGGPERQPPGAHTRPGPPDEGEAEGGPAGIDPGLRPPRNARGVLDLYA